MEDGKNTVRMLKISKTRPDLRVDIKMTESIKKKINIHNVSSYFTLANRFNLPNLFKQTFEYIQRCFVMVGETDGFLELDFSLVRKIFAIPICTSHLNSKSYTRHIHGSTIIPWIMIE